MEISGPVCAFMSSVTWAIGSSTYAKLSNSYSAFSVNFTRAMIALPLFFAAVLITQGGMSSGFESLASLPLETIGWFALSMLASYGLGDVLFMWSTSSLGVPGALAIASAYPVWTVFFGSFFRGETLGSLQLIGLSLTLFGMATVILHAPSAGRNLKGTRSELLKGVFLAVLTSFMWALNSFASAKGGESVTPFVGNFFRMAIALLACGALSLHFRNRNAQYGISIPRREIKTYFGLFAFEAFGGSAFYLYGLSHTTLVIGATLSSLAPVLAVPIALVLKTENYSFYRTAGVVLTVLGLIFLVGFSAS